MSVCMWLINYRSAILADLVILGLSRFIASFTRPVVKLASVVVRYSHHMSEIFNISGFNVTYQFIFRSSHLVNLLSWLQLRSVFLSAR